MLQRRLERAPLLSTLLLIGQVACGGDPGGTGPSDLSAGVNPNAGAAVGTAPPAAANGPRTPVVTAPIAGSASSVPSIGPDMSAAAGAAAPSVPATNPGATGPADPHGTWCGVKQTLDSRCIACHNEQKTAGAPMSLKTHADLMAAAVSDPSKKVFQLVGTRVHDTQRPMPPQEKLTAVQLAGIDTWVAAGAPAGTDPTCKANGPALEPMAQVWPDNCDDTYKILISDAGGGPSTVGPGQEAHPQFQVPPPWGSEEVQAIAWRAITDNPKVLHHWILYGPQGEFLFGWAPGKDNNEPLPPDVGVYLPPSSMRLDVHYNNTQGSQAEQDSSGVEICILRRAHFRAKTATVTNALSSRLINIPPRAVDQEVTATCMHSGQPVHILSASPHAHRTAHHMKFTVEKASGETIVMHDDDFNFAEQTTYAMAPPVEIVAGDRITTTCTFTNDTDQTITFGENTGNEMCFNFALYEPMGGLSCGLGGGGFPRF